MDCTSNFVSQSVSTSCIVNSVDIQTIRDKLGHISWSKLKHISEFQNVDSSIRCYTCQPSKFHKIPFTSNHNKSTTPFELIHIDIWGPYKYLALDGSSHFLTIVEDCTKYIWTHLMSSKSQVPSVLKSFFHYIHNHFNTTTKFVRSDNDNEFLTKECSSFFHQYGIIHQLSITYTPQQNGVVEYKYRHLLDTVRSLKTHAHLPSSF